MGCYNIQLLADMQNPGIQIRICDAPVLAALVVPPEMRERRRHKTQKPTGHCQGRQRGALVKNQDLIRRIRISFQPCRQAKHIVAR